MTKRSRRKSRPVTRYSDDTPDDPKSVAALNAKKEETKKEKLRHPIGTIIRKNFSPGGWSYGRVKSHRGRHYYVEFDDADENVEMLETELNKYVVWNKTRQKPSIDEVGQVSAASRGNNNDTKQQLLSKPSSSLKPAIVGKVTVPKRKYNKVYGHAKMPSKKLKIDEAKLDELRKKYRKVDQPASNNDAKKAHSKASSSLKTGIAGKNVAKKQKNVEGTGSTRMEIDETKLAALQKKYRKTRPKKAARKSPPKQLQSTRPGSKFPASQAHGYSNNNEVDDSDESTTAQRSRFTANELSYIDHFVRNFAGGLLDLPRGTVLRTYLSGHLNSDPKNLSDTVLGEPKIGDSRFKPLPRTPQNSKRIDEAQRILQKLDKKLPSQTRNANIPNIIQTNYPLHGQSIQTNTHTAAAPKKAPDSNLTAALRKSLTPQQQEQRQHQQEATLSALRTMDDAQRLFPSKLHDMLDSAEAEGYSDIVAWRPSGDCFRTYQSARLAEEVLPRFTNQRSYKSFTRQLNLWGFERQSEGINKGSYGHRDGLLRRGNRELCRFMVRRKLASGNPEESEMDADIRQELIDEHFDRPEGTGEAPPSPATPVALPPISTPPVAAAAPPIDAAAMPTYVPAPASTTNTTNVPVHAPFQDNVWENAAGAATINAASIPPARGSILNQYENRLREQDPFAWRAAQIIALPLTPAQRVHQILELGKLAQSQNPSTPSSLATIANIAGVLQLNIQASLSTMIQNTLATSALVPPIPPIPTVPTMASLAGNATLFTGQPQLFGNRPAVALKTNGNLTANATLPLPVNMFTATGAITPNLVNGFAAILANAATNNHINDISNNHINGNNLNQTNNSSDYTNNINNSTNHTNGNNINDNNGNDINISNNSNINDTNHFNGNGNNHTTNNGNGIHIGNDINNSNNSRSATSISSKHNNGNGNQSNSKDGDNVEGLSSSIVAL